NRWRQPHLARFSLGGLQVSGYQPIDCSLPVAYRFKAFKHSARDRPEPLAVVALDACAVTAPARRWLRSSRREFDAFTTWRDFGIGDTLEPVDNLSIPRLNDSIDQAIIKIDARILVGIRDGKRDAIERIRHCAAL